MLEKCVEKYVLCWKGMWEMWVVCWKIGGNCYVAMEIFIKEAF